MLVVDSVAEPMPAPPVPPVAVTVELSFMVTEQRPSDRQATPIPALRPLPEATTVALPVIKISI